MSSASWYDVTREFDERRVDKLRCSRRSSVFVDGHELLLIVVVLFRLAKCFDTLDEDVAVRQV